jgi:hypothetical protein
VDNPRYSELRDQLNSIDFPVNDDEGYMSHLSLAFRLGGKAYHGLVIAAGLPSLIDSLKQQLISNLLTPDNG